MKRCGNYWVPDAEELQLEALAAGGWQLERLEVALKYVTEWHLAIDGGAHVGSWSLAMAKRFDEVLAFEPAPDSIECLLENVEARRNIYVQGMALGDRRGLMLMADDERFGTRNTGGRHLSANIDDGPVVAVMPLDLVGLRRVGFLKLDVEGYEPMALRGAEATIKRCKPVIMVEDKKRMAQRYGYEPGEARRILERWGATEVDHVGDDHIFAWR